MAQKAVCAYVYMLRCSDGSLYTGWTTDLQRRVADHRAGRGGRYTRSRRPLQLVLQALHGLADTTDDRRIGVGEHQHIHGGSSLPKQMMDRTPAATIQGAVQAGAGRHPHSQFYALTSASARQR